MPIANTIRELDNNLYTINQYMTFGWDGLRTNYAYTNGSLTKELDAYYLNLRSQQTNINIPFCIE